MCVPHCKKGVKIYIEEQCRCHCPWLPYAKRTDDWKDPRDDVGFYIAHGRWFVWVVQVGDKSWWDVYLSEINNKNVTDFLEDADILTIVSILKKIVKLIQREKWFFPLYCETAWSSTEYCRRGDSFMWFSSFKLLPLSLNLENHTKLSPPTRKLSNFF